MQLELPNLTPAKVISSRPPSAQARSPEELFQALSALMGHRLSRLVLTANRSRILSCRPARNAPDGFDLRLHKCFLTAEPDVLKTVAHYALGALRGLPRRRALAILRQHFEKHRGWTETTARPRRPSKVRLDSKGRAVDLRALFDGLNERYFAGRIDAGITWGRALARKTRRPATRRTLRLGSYDMTHNLIRIHRVLDDPKVPREVIEVIVYHEMLHADLPPVVVGGRRYSHTPEFRRREKLHPSYSLVEAWLEDHLPYLLSARFRRC